MELAHLKIEELNSWLEVTLNRPEALNALDAATLEDLETVIGELRGREDLRGAILTGAGEKAFVAGADISELADLSSPEAIRYARRGQQVFDLLEP